MDNKQRFAILNKNRQLIKQICPEISEKSGIYLFHRKCEDGNLGVYVGQAKNLLQRTAQHLIDRKQHIDKSLYVHKLYSKDNPLGWKLEVACECGLDKLDILEQRYIEFYQNISLCELYNVTGGGQKDKKQDINERQQTKLKSYKNGKNLGETKAKTYIKTMFDKYLDFVIKPPANKIKERKFEEFKNYLGGTEE